MAQFSPGQPLYRVCDPSHSGDDLLVAREGPVVESRRLLQDFEGLLVSPFEDEPARRLREQAGRWRIGGLVRGIEDKEEKEEREGKEVIRKRRRKK